MLSCPVNVKREIIPPPPKKQVWEAGILQRPEPGSSTSKSVSLQLTPSCSAVCGSRPPWPPSYYIYTPHSLAPPPPPPPPAHKVDLWCLLFKDILLRSKVRFYSPVLTCQLLYDINFFLDIICYENSECISIQNVSVM